MEAKKREMSAENIQRPFTCSSVNLNRRLDGEPFDAPGPSYVEGGRESASIGHDTRWMRYVVSANPNSPYSGVGIGRPWGRPVCSDPHHADITASESRPLALANTGKGGGSVDWEWRDHHSDLIRGGACPVRLVNFNPYDPQHFLENREFIGASHANER